MLRAWGRAGKPLQSCAWGQCGKQVASALSFWGFLCPPKQQEEWLAPSGPPHQEQQSRPCAWCRGDRPLLHFHAACPAVQNCAGTQRKERGRNPQSKATCPVSPSRARSQTRAQVSWLDSLAPLPLVGLGPEGHCPLATFLPH